MKTNILILSVLVLALASCAVGQPATTAAPAAATQGAAAVQPMTKCDWLRANFPQTTEAIQALGAQLAAVDPSRIATHVFRCTPETTVFDGFIVLGPNEGHTGLFNLDVPVGGAVDTYASATCSGQSQLLGSATDTVRCLSGTVTAERATYWPWLDENPPVSGGVTSSQSVAGTCIDPTALAAQQGWTYTGSPDTYGGLVVTLASSATLPHDWESVGPAGSIKEFDVNREMSAGTHTIYPPYSCRVALGYSQ